MKPKTKLQELRKRNPWKQPVERKGRGRGRAQGKSSFNPPTSRKANAERTEPNAVEFGLLRSLREP